MRDMVLIPCLYEVAWAQDLNNLLAEHFTVLEYSKAYSYLPSRDKTHLYISNMLPKLRKSDVKRIFFVNYLDDFHIDYQKSGFIKQFYGLIHTSAFFSETLSATKKTKAYEKAIGDMATHLFTTLPKFAEKLPYPAEAIGLPLFNEFNEPVLNDRILFNSRLTKQKGADLFCNLPSDMLDKAIVSTPFVVQSEYYSALQKRLGHRFASNIPKSQYLKLAKGSGFCFSLSQSESFSYAIVEAIQAGCTPLALVTKETAFTDYLLPDFQCESLEQVRNAYQYFIDNPAERTRLVRKQQEAIKQWQADKWINTLKGKLCTN